MMTIDRLEKQIEELTEQVRSRLSFVFKDADLQKDAEDARDEIVDLLEGYLESATQDWEQRPDIESENEDDENSP